MWEEEASCFSPAKMRLLCRLLRVNSAEAVRELRFDLLRARRSYRLKLVEERSIRLSEMHDELRAGARVLGAAAEWVQQLSGATQTALEGAILGKDDAVFKQWTKDLPGFRIRRERPLRKRVLNFHRDIMEGIPWLLRNVLDCASEMEKDKGGSRPDVRNELIVSLMIIFETYTGEPAAGHITHDHEGYRGVTLDFVKEVLAEIDPEHGLSIGALGARVRRASASLGQSTCASP